MSPGDIKKLCFKELCWARACEKTSLGPSWRPPWLGLAMDKSVQSWGSGCVPRPAFQMLCFQVSLELHCGGCMCFVAGMVSLFRRVLLPSPHEVAQEDAGELLTGPLPPRPANKTAVWPKLTS